MDRAVALRRCSVTGYIPGIPRGHGHISSSSRFPVPHTPGLPTPSRNTQAGTRNNGARIGTGPLVAPLNFPRFGFWFTSTSRCSTPGCKWPERKNCKVQSIRSGLYYCAVRTDANTIILVPSLRYQRRSHRWRRLNRAFIFISALFFFSF